MFLVLNVYRTYKIKKKKIITDEIPEEVQEQLENFPVKIEAKSSHTIQIRFILAAMGFWCFFVLASLRVNLSLGIVAMVNWTGIREDMDAPHAAQKAECDYPKRINRTRTEDGPFLWDTHIQGHILSCYFYGLASTQLVGGRVAELVSAKYVLLVGTLLATLANLIVPPVAMRSGAYGLMALQVFKGFGQGIVMPAFSVLMGKWVPPVERARFMSVIASGLPVGSFFTVVISGILCKMNTFGWPYVFYIFGIVAILWCVFWGILIYDSPLTHPYITKEELNRIMTVRSHKAPDAFRVKVPLKQILSSRPVWAYICAGFSSSWALCLYASVIPMFLGTVLKYDIETNGLMSSMPNIAEAFFLLSTSVISDRLLKRKLLTATTIRKACIGTGLIGFSVCIVLVTLTGCHRILTVLFLVLALGLSGFSFSSTAVVPVDMAPRFAANHAGVVQSVLRFGPHLSPGRHRLHLVRIERDAGLELPTTTTTLRGRRIFQRTARKEETCGRRRGRFRKALVVPEGRRRGRRGIREGRRAAVEGRVLSGAEAGNEALHHAEIVKRLRGATACWGTTSNITSEITDTMLIKDGGLRMRRSAGAESGRNVSGVEME